MIIPCIDLMGGKVVQLVQGQENSKAFALPDPLAVLEEFHEYPEIQVIDLDAAMGREAQSDIVRAYQPRLRGFIRRMLDDDHTADDLLQDVWFDVFRGVRKLKDVGVFRPKMTQVDKLYCGDVGYVIANVKTTADVKIGDTLTETRNPAPQALPGGGRDSQRRARPRSRERRRAQGDRRQRRLHLNRDL